MYAKGKIKGLVRESKYQHDKLNLKSRNTGCQFASFSIDYRYFPFVNLKSINTEYLTTNRPVCTVGHSSTLSVYFDNCSNINKVQIC